MPDRDYYLSDDARLKGVREKYASYVKDLLAAADTPDAAAAAEKIFALESRSRRRTGRACRIATPRRPTTATICAALGEADAVVRLERVPRAARRSRARKSQALDRHAAELLRSARQGVRRRAGRRLAHLLPLQAAAAPTRRTCRRSSCSCSSTSTTAPCRASRRSSRAGSAASTPSKARSAISSARCTSSATSARSEAPHGRAGRQSARRRSRSGIDDLEWMTPATKREGAREARAVHDQDRLSRQVARLVERSRCSRDDLIGNEMRAAAVVVRSRRRTSSAARSTAPNG